MTDFDSQWPSRYLFFPDLCLTSSNGNYHLRPIHWGDREVIRNWRNDQIDVLRQSEPLSTVHQDTYFSQIVLPQLSEKQPDQILFAFLKATQLVGYGGFVHIRWPESSAEVSFLTDTNRSDLETFTQDWTEYLLMLVILARRIGFHTLTTETYSNRPQLIAILENFGFQCLNIVPNHHLIDGKPVDSMVHEYVIDVN